MRKLQQAALLVLGSLAIAGALHTSFNEGLDGWVHSSDSKYGGQFEVEKIPGLDVKGLKVPEKARHYGITKVIDEVDPAEDLVLQYDLKLASGLSCGGAYLKFLTSDSGFKAADLKDDTPYTVMFGPDKCGATNKVHLILRHKSPKTGKIEEKHLKNPPSVPFDEKTHVYTAILKASDNTYKVLIDGEVKKEGSLYDDFDPPINPPKEIPDPEDKKPADWVDEAKIKDPNAVKPDDWDEDAPAFIPDEAATKPEGWLDDEPAEVDDPEAEKPEDWDDEEDGEWEPPQIPNPKCKEAPGCGEWKRPTKPNPAYKGKWSAPLIDNPAYKGPWSPRNIPNPDHYEDEEPLKHIGKVGAVAIEIWTMDDNYFFDNVVVSNSELEAEELRQQTFKPKKDAEDKAEADKKAKEEEERKKAEEAEKKKEKKEKKKEQAKSEVESNKEKSAEKAKALLDQLFELPLLQPYASQLAPVREFLEENPLVLYLGGGVLATLLLMPLFALLGSGGKKVDAAAIAKKKDITGADDQPAAAAAAAAKKGRNGKAAEAEGEIEEDESEEEEEEKPAARRKGARKAD